MNQITEEGELDFGVGFDGEMHCAFTLRPATLADTYAATAAVPVPDGVSDNPAARVAYQMAIDDAQILCQLIQLGTLDPVPSVQALVATVDPDDMAILRVAAISLKKKLRQPKNASHPIDAPSTSSSAPASA